MLLDNDGDHPPNNAKWHTRDVHRYTAHGHHPQRQAHPHNGWQHTVHERHRSLRGTLIATVAVSGGAESGAQLPWVIRAASVLLHGPRRQEGALGGRCEEKPTCCASSCLHPPRERAQGAVPEPSPPNTHRRSAAGRERCVAGILVRTCYQAWIHGAVEMAAWWCGFLGQPHDPALWRCGLPPQPLHHAPGYHFGRQALLVQLRVLVCALNALRNINSSL